MSGESHDSSIKSTRILRLGQLIGVYENFIEVRKFSFNIEKLVYEFQIRRGDNYVGEWVGGVIVYGCDTRG